MEQSCAIVCEYPKDTRKSVTGFKPVAKLQPANFRLLWGCFGFWVITPAVRLRNFRNRSPSATLLKNEVSTRHRPALQNFCRGVGTIDTLCRGVAFCQSIRRTVDGAKFAMIQNGIITPAGQQLYETFVGQRFRRNPCSARVRRLFVPLADMTRSKLSRSQTRYGCNFALVAGGVLTVAIPFAVGCQ